MKESIQFALSAGISLFISFASLIPLSNSESAVHDIIPKLVYSYILVVAIAQWAIVLVLCVLFFRWLFDWE